ncbi:MAG: hypothetical protein ACO3N7_04680 [Kiritimatiellia bacterium]
MRSSLTILFFLCGFSSAHLAAQDVQIQYLKIQENYTLRVEDIRLRHKKSTQELLNKFILALVRVEQRYRDDGDLVGVVFCRDLREKMLVEQEFPQHTENAPEEVEEILKVLTERHQESSRTHQQELDQLNLMLYNALEAYQREFTRQSMIEMAQEIFNIREVLTETAIAAEKRSQDTEVLPTGTLTDPNQFPFGFEGTGYAATRGVIPRNCVIELSTEVNGQVEMTPLGYRFVNGRLRFPANQSVPFLSGLFQNGMFSAEIAFQPDFDLQGFPNSPVILFQLGEKTENALFSVTLEGTEFYLYFQTDSPPPERANHRYRLGSLKANTPTHLCVTYRPGELFAYENGVAVLQLRDEVKGGFSDWEPTPILVGKALPKEDAEAFIFPYRGVLNHVYLREGNLSSRQVVSNYNRYLRLFE